MTTEFNKNQNGTVSTVIGTEEETIYSRTERLLGKESVSKLSNAKVAVFGVGGVGGYVVEALVRSGIGSIDIIDKDGIVLIDGIQVCRIIYLHLARVVGMAFFNNSHYLVQFNTYIFY